jgi:hypothetical protein
MKSRKITSLNPYVTSINQKYVKAQDYNNLKDDFDTIATALGFNPELGNTTESNYLTSIVTVTSPEILALAASPKVLVAAPGAGYALHFVSAILIFDSTVTAYANGSALSVAYDSGADQSSTIAATMFTAGDKIYNFERLNAANGLTHPVNTALVLKAAGAEFITGTGVARIHITYSVITTGL